MTFPGTASSFAAAAHDVGDTPDVLLVQGGILLLRRMPEGGLGCASSGGMRSNKALVFT